MKVSQRTRRNSEDILRNNSNTMKRQKAHRLSIYGLFTLFSFNLQQEQMLLPILSLS